MDERKREEERLREAKKELGEDRKKTPPVSEETIEEAVERGPAERQESPRK